jgi:hypothetical protein
VPLALFGAARYPLVIGRLAMPSLVVQALAPSAGALVITVFGASPTIALLTALAALNLALALALMGSSRRPTDEY